MDVNIPEVVEEVRALFERYEQALIEKDDGLGVTPRLPKLSDVDVGGKSSVSLHLPLHRLLMTHLNAWMERRPGEASVSAIFRLLASHRPLDEVLPHLVQGPAIALAFATQAAAGWWVRNGSQCCAASLQFRIRKSASRGPGIQSIGL